MMNDHIHPNLSQPSLIYIKPFRSRAGFMLCIDHNETLKLPLESAIALLRDKIGQIYAVDAKRLRYFLNRNNSVFCIKTGKFIYSNEIIDESSFNTSAHRYFYSKYEYIEDINKIIPVCKHYEKMEKLISSIGFNQNWFKSRYYKLYGSMAIDVYKKIESNGIKIDRGPFSQHYKPKSECFSIRKDKIYSSYNLFTATGRPSNAFNGINFSAMNKEDGSRLSFVSSNDLLIEFDYSSYHLRILAQLIDYQFEEQDIHTHLGKNYYGKSELTPEEYHDSKALTFKLLYTDSMAKELQDIPFFKKVYEFKNQLWEKYKKNGFIESFISKRPIKNMDSKTQILPYILQNYETERNIMIISDLLNILEGRKTKLVLYNYDSFLFDYSRSDGKEILNEIKDILEQELYFTSCSFGKNYQDMKKI